MLRLALGLMLVGVVGGAAAEIALRLHPALLPETAQLRLLWSGLEGAFPTSPDPDLGFIATPDQHVEVRYGSFGFSYTTDGQGFRNRPRWPPGADIVAIGDSQTFGYGVGDDEGWVALLDRDPANGRVINLGINGGSPMQQIRVLEKFQERLRPRLVLLGLFPGNALGANAEFQGWLDAGQPGSFLDFRKQASGEAAWKRLVRWASERSYLLLFARTVAEEMTTPYGGSTLEFADGGRICMTPYVYAGHAAVAKAGSPRFESVLDAVERLRGLAERAGSGFLVVLFPTKEEVYLPLHGQPAPDLQGPFAAALTADGVAVLDLLPALRARAATGERLFLELDIHPNQAGYQLIAGEVRRRLATDPWRSPPMAGTSPPARHTAAD